MLLPGVEDRVQGARPSKFGRMLSVPDYDVIWGDEHVSFVLSFLPVCEV